MRLVSAFAAMAISTLLFASAANGKNMFTGNETVLQVVEKLKAEKAGLYDRKIVVHTTSGSHEGMVIGMGSSYLVLESDTGRSNIDSGPAKKIFVQKLIQLSSINGFEFTVTK